MTRDELGSEIESRILSGELIAGTKLPSERQLADQYRVSRPIVREVLRTLSERNLIEVLPARGSYVRGPRSTDPADMLDMHYRRSQATPRDLVEARIMLECRAAELASERATPADLQAIDQAAEGFDNAGTIIDRVHFDLAFHLAIARACHNPVIDAMFGSITNLTMNLMLRSLSDRQIAKSANPFHSAVRIAIHEGNAKDASDAMLAHLSVASTHYGDDYDRSIESVIGGQLTRMMAPEMPLEDLVMADTTGGGAGRQYG